MSVPAKSSLPLTLWLTPQGHLRLAPFEDTSPCAPSLLEAITPAFVLGTGHGLLHLGAVGVDSVLPPPVAFWRDVAAHFLTALCTSTEEDSAEPVMPPVPVDKLEALLLGAPPMPGGEYLSLAVLTDLWEALQTAFLSEWRQKRQSVQAFLKNLNPAWHLVGRVHFHLAENRKDPDYPFAFLATYTSRLSAQGKAQHLPLGQALKTYADAKEKGQLLSLLLPVQRAAEQLDWLSAMVSAGEIYHPIRWQPQDAFRLLGAVEVLEQSGVVVRLPATWKAGRPNRPQVRVKVGSQTPSSFGKDALLDFQLSVSLGDESLTQEEWKALLAATHGLAFIRGQWVEVDPEKLQKTLATFQEAERLAQQQGLPFAEAMRLLAGAAGLQEKGLAAPEPIWSQVEAGPWLREVLKGLRSPEGLAAIEPGPGLHARLRPYQQVGLRWLYHLSSLGLGACLADDMGLGKTLQVLALLHCRRKTAKGPSLLVVPASLLANWVAEADRFVPTLRKRVLHPSVCPGQSLKGVPEGLADVDLAITSYGTVLRAPWMADHAWDLVILDEAQAIKNAGTKQTRAVKQLPAKSRIALTGTPVENRAGDLWSLFDFINPGLLGSANRFTTYMKSLQDQKSGGYGPLRDLVRPYILRRLKTDQSVIADLPDKTELKAYCTLSRAQAVLYQQAVEELAKQLADEDIVGMKRRGLVLASIMRFKQICNHPSQWLGDEGWQAADSGKFARLRELCEVIAAKQEKVLIFTQFKEVIGPLSAFLTTVFGRPGLVLHGETAVQKRKALVDAFQHDDNVPFFVLSLKAGGSGLNLTAASHVIHFDRWWNPAVENQATDRAFRIGQTRNVLVHKFICQGTMEEKLDGLIEAKRQLAHDLLEGGKEVDLASLSDEELLRLVSLDIQAAMGE